MKKQIKAWAVVNDRDFDKAKGEIIKESLVQTDYSDCLCQAELYDSYAVFTTKKEAENYKLTWQKIVPIIITLLHSRNK